MDRGMYAAASGGMTNLRQIEIIANNLANINTVGFKRQRLATKQQGFDDTLTSQLRNMPERAASDQVRTPAAIDVRSITDFAPGPIKHTGNPLNVALTGNDEFFSVQTPQGVRLTRAGNFTLNATGTLVTQDGFPVLGQGGQITFPPENKARISGTGAIISGDEVIDRIRVVRIEDFGQVERTEGARFNPLNNQPVNVENPDLVAGSVEMPNVSAVEAMIELVNAHRAFEAYQKTAREIDNLNEQAIRSASTR